MSYVAAIKPTQIYCSASFVETEDPLRTPDETVSTLHALTYVEDGHASRCVDQSCVEEILTWMAESALGGDIDAAYWILLTSLCATGLQNHEANQPNLSLTLFPFPPSPLERPMTPSIVEILQQILPLVSLAVTQDLLQHKPAGPAVGDKGDLHAGFLQLPKRSIVLLSEFNLPPGIGWANEKAKENVRVVQDVMDKQTLAYSFPYSQLDFSTNLRFIIITPYRSSEVFHTHFDLIVRPGAIIDLYKPLRSDHQPSPERLSTFRKLIKGVDLAKISISNSCSELIQNDFIEARREDFSISAKHLSSWIYLAKAMAWIDGRSQVAADTWNKVRDLDNRRKNRVIIE